MLRDRITVSVAAAVMVVSSVCVDSFGRQRVWLPPVDEASSDPVLKRTRDDLLRAVKRRDVDGVMQRVHRDFVLDGQRGYPTDRLRRALVTGRPWRLDSSLWVVLDRVVSSGGAFTTTRGSTLERREFCAPYTFARLPRVVPEPLQSEVSPWVVSVDSAPLYRSPSTSRRSSPRFRMTSSRPHDTSESTVDSGTASRWGTAVPDLSTL